LLKVDNFKFFFTICIGKWNFTKFSFCGNGPSETWFRERDFLNVKEGYINLQWYYTIRTILIILCQLIRLLPGAALEGVWGGTPRTHERVGKLLHSFGKNWAVWIWTEISNYLNWNQTWI
jgi:hypothetical protein